MLLTTMIIRTLLCRPKEIDAGEYKAREFDKDLIARHLSEAVQIPTVSMVGEFEGVDQPFYDYHAWLETITALFIVSKAKIRLCFQARFWHTKTSYQLPKRAGITNRSAAR